MSRSIKGMIIINVICIGHACSDKCGGVSFWNKDCHSVQCFVGNLTVDRTCSGRWSYPGDWDAEPCITICKHSLIFVVLHPRVVFEVGHTSADHLHLESVRGASPQGQSLIATYTDGQCVLISMVRFDKDLARGSIHRYQRTSVINLASHVGWNTRPKQSWAKDIILATYIYLKHLIGNCWIDHWLRCREYNKDRHN